MLKAIIVLVLGIALLGGAGFGGWKLYNMYLVRKEEGAEPPPPPPPPPTSFVRMNSFAVPVIGDGKVQQFVTVITTLEVVAEKAPIVQANQPRLADSFLTTLYGALDDKSVMSGTLVNIVALKDKLMKAAAKTVGEGLVTDVLIQVVMQRNL